MPIAAVVSTRIRRRIRADVLDEVDVDGEDVAVLVERHSHLAVDVSGLPGRHQVLAPVLDPLQRRGDLAGGQHDAHVLAHRDDLLAEPAAGVAHDDPNMSVPACPAVERRTHAVREGSAWMPTWSALRGRLPTRRRCRASPSAPARTSAGKCFADVTCAAEEKVSSSGGAPTIPPATIVGIGVVDDDIRVHGLGEVGDGRQW